MPRSLTTHIDSPAKLGERLREARLRAGLSQRRLMFPGCTSAYISRLEGGFRTPSLQMVNELASRVGVDPTWLARGVSDEASQNGVYVRQLESRVHDLEERLSQISSLATG